MTRVFACALLAVAATAIAPAADTAPPPREHRLLVNLARSALGDAFFELQNALDARNAAWHDWAIFEGQGGKERRIPPVSTRESLAATSGAGPRFAIDDVRVVLVRAIPEGAAFGLVDLKVTVRLQDPAAALTLVQRHTMDLTDAFSNTGRTVELSATPVTTIIESGAPGAAVDQGESAEDTALAIVHADMLQAVQKSDPDSKATVEVSRTQTQMIVAKPAPGTNISGYLVNYRLTPPGDGDRRLIRRLAGGSAPVPGLYADVAFGLFDGAGGRFARVTLRPRPADANAVPSPPLTALVRVAGPEMLGSDMFDWSFMNGLNDVHFLKPQE